MNVNYPNTAFAYLRNKLILVYNALQAISNTRLFDVNEEKANQFFKPKLSFSLKHNNKIFIETDVFKSHPVVFITNLFYTISGSAIFCNLSIIMRHMRRPPTPLYALRHATYNTNFKNNNKLQKQL